jgi:hypothetical protein
MVSSLNLAWNNPNMNKKLISVGQTYLCFIQNNQLHVLACNKAIIRLHIRIAIIQLTTVIYASQNLNLLHHLQTDMNFNSVMN